jgi:hypothetical protein
MSAQCTAKWFGIHKLQETMGALTVELARLSADPHDLKPSRSLVARVESKMADVLAALQWFEYHNKLDVDPDRMERTCETYDAYHRKTVAHVRGQTYMHGIVAVDPETLLNDNEGLVLTLSDDDKEPETLPSTQSVPELMSGGCFVPGCDECPETKQPESAEVSNGRG